MNFKYLYIDDKKIRKKERKKERKLKTKCKRHRIIKI